MIQTLFTERKIDLNLVMCDRKCLHQEEGYCKVSRCSINDANGVCPYYEAQKETKKGGITIEFPERKVAEEIPAVCPDLPTLPEQKLL